MLGLLLLGWASGYDRLRIAFIVCLCRLLGIQRLTAVTVVTVLYLLLSEPFSGMVTNHWPGIDLILQARYGETYLDLPAVKYFGFLGRLIMGYLLYRMVGRLARGQKLVALHLAGLALLFACDGALRAGPLWGAVIMYGLISFSFFFHYLCYIALESPSLSPARFYRLYIAAFWENSTSPRPTLELIPEPAKRSYLTTRCLKAAWSASLLILTGSLVQAFVYSTKFHGHLLPFSITPLPDVTTLGPTTSLFLVYPRWQIGLSLLWTGLHRITNYFALFVFIECCHLMLGQDVPKRFTFPLKASTFGDFYNCIMPYYVIVVNRLYLYPYYSVLRKLNWNRFLAYDVALLAGIFSAGFVTHCLRDVHLVALLGAGDFLWRSLVTDASYCFLLFLAIRFAKIPPFWENKMPVLVRFLLFLTVYSLVIFFRVGGLFVSFEERLKFCCMLFSGYAW